MQLVGLANTRILIDYAQKSPQSPVTCTRNMNTKSRLKSFKSRAVLPGYYNVTMLPCELQPHENVSRHKLGELLKVLITK